MSNQDPFSLAGDHVKIAEFEGRLLLCTPLEYLTGIKTEYRDDQDAVDAQIVVLDGDDAPQELGEVRVFQGRLVGALKRKIGTSRPMILGRLATVANKSGKASDPRPYVFETPTEIDSAVARKYIAGLNEKDPFSN